MNNLNREQTDLIVSILNAIAEESGYNVDIEGFGYDKDLNISCADCDLTEGLEDIWECLCNMINNK